MLVAQETKQALINEVLRSEYQSEDQPGAAVLIMQGPDTLFAGCYGWADQQTKAPVDFNTHFCIASVSKQFAAVALLQLCEQGMLSLYTSLQQLFPRLKAPFYRDITLHHILSHTSGIPDARPRNDRDFVLHATSDQSVRYMDTLTTLNFTPGTRYEYINPTYQMAELIIPQVSGESFEHYMQRHVFDPAGMMSTVYFEPARGIPHMAHGYEPDGAGGYKEYDYDEETFFATKADGGIYTSISDFMQWQHALHDLKVLSESSLRKAWTPWVELGPDANYGYQPHTGYGYGFFIQHRPGRPDIIYHTGDNGGFTIYAGQMPEKEIFFLFFSTRNDIDRMGLVNKIWDIVLAE